MGKRAFIFCACCQSVEEAAFYRRLKFSPDDLLICADGGYDLACAIGVTPHVVIGDLDSIQSIVSSGIQVLDYPPEKDQTDLHLSIDYALEQGATELVILGAFGGRIDHSLAALYSLGYIAQRGADNLLLTKKARVTAITSHLELNHGNIGKISLMPLTESVEGVTTRGLKYALDNATLYQLQNLGVSNCFTENTASITLRKGILLVLCEDEL